MGAANIENQEGNNVFDLDPKIAVVEDLPEDVPHETPLMPRVKIVKMPRHMETSLKNGVQFSFGGWIFEVYHERKGQRYSVRTIGKVEIIQEKAPTLESELGG